MKYFFLLLLLSFNFGCSSYYTERVCTPSHQVDLPNFEGAFYGTNYVMDTLDIEKYQFQIQRKSQGTYTMSAEFISSPTELRVCEFDSQIYLESSSTETEVKGYVLNKIIKQGDGSFDFVQMGIGTKVLKAKGIPFQIIEEPAKKLAATWGVRTDEELKIRYLLADNKGLDSDGFVQLFTSMSFKMTIFPDPAGVRTSGTSRNSIGKYFRSLLVK